MAAQDRYNQPLAFKTALEARLRSEAKRTARPIVRVRQTLPFDRMLARAFAIFGERLVLKGGLALELRVSRARTTKDIDLRPMGATADVLTLLQQAGRTDLGDWLTFLIEPDRAHPVIEGEGAVYTGQRFRVQAQLGGARFGDPFGLDVGVADVLTDPPEVIQGSTFLQFVDVPAAPLRVYPRTAHVSEKVHAYTLPRERPNSRVKDLPDLALLASSGPFERLRLRKALEATFEFRKTHALPTNLPSPPREWEQPYARMAANDDLPWSSLAKHSPPVMRRPGYSPTHAAVRTACVGSPGADWLQVWRGASPCHQVRAGWTPQCGDRRASVSVAPPDRGHVHPRVDGPT